MGNFCCCARRTGSTGPRWSGSTCPKRLRRKGLLRPAIRAWLSTSTSCISRPERRSGPCFSFAGPRENVDGFGDPGFERKSLGGNFFVSEPREATGGGGRRLRGTNAGFAERGGV